MRVWKTLFSRKALASFTDFLDTLPSCIVFNRGTVRGCLVLSTFTYVQKSRHC